MRLTWGRPLESGTPRPDGLSGERHFGVPRGIHECGHRPRRSQVTAGDEDDVLQLDVVASQEREFQPAIAMSTDIRLEDLGAYSVLAIGGERKGEEGTLAPSAPKRRVRDLIRRA